MDHWTVARLRSGRSAGIGLVRHCRLTLEGQRWLLEDLRSTNGTFVDGARLAPGQPLAITPAEPGDAGWAERDALADRGDCSRGRDAVPGAPGTSLDANTQLGIIRIGRAPDNDHVSDLPMISGHHNRIVRESGREGGGEGNGWILEDTNSRDGVAVNRLENRVQRVVIHPADDIYFGSYKVSVSQLLGAQKY